MLVAKRAHCIEPVLPRMGFAAAARTVGTPKSTGKGWRNGRMRATGGNETPCRKRTKAAMTDPKSTDAKYLNGDEHAPRADGLACGASMPGITESLNMYRSPGTATGRAAGTHRTAPESPRPPGAPGRWPDRRDSRTGAAHRQAAAEDRRRRNLPDGWSDLAGRAPPPGIAESCAPAGCGGAAAIKNCRMGRIAERTAVLQPMLLADCLIFHLQ